MCLAAVASLGEFDWGSWWGYDGISGPSFWGVINRGWRLCNDGRRQSPVNFDTRQLVYDHTLRDLLLHGAQVGGAAGAGGCCRWCWRVVSVVLEGGAGSAGGWYR